MKTESTSLQTYLRQVANRTLNYDFTVWFWGDSIAFDGLVEASTILSDETYFEFCMKYYDRWMKRSLTYVDHLTPGYALLQIYNVQKEARLLDAAERLAKFLLEEIPRTRDGAPLYRPDQPEYRHAMWVDTIYHMPSFYALLGKITGNTTYFDEAVRELQLHTRWLSSPQGPFLCHGVNTGNNVLKGYGWGRGTGWAVFGMVDTLELLPQNHALYASLVEEFQLLAEAIRKVQDASGFWRTLLHDNEAYLEASTATFYGAAFAKARRLDLLDSTFDDSIDRAWRATLSRLQPDGSFTGVSACTWASTAPVDSATMYKTLPTEVNVWGQGSALRFIAEQIHSELETGQL